MLNAFPIVGFVTTANADRAVAFYRDALGLEFLGDDGFALVFRAKDATIRIAKLPAVTPLPFTVLGWEVTGLRGVLVQMERAGVKFEKFPGMPQDESGVWIAPDGTLVAWFKDPDGNVLSISEHVPAQA